MAAVADITLGSFRWSAITPARAARASAGVLMPLIIGWACGRLDLGGFAAFGALSAGTVSLRGVARTRMLAIGLASLGMALSTFVGATIAAAQAWLLVPAVIGYGYAAGIAVSLGPTVSVAVLQWPVALLVAVGLPLPPREAATRAALVLAGGLLQGLLVAWSWTVRAGTGERFAVAHSLRALAGYAGDLAAGAVDPPPPTDFAATSALEDPNPLLADQAHLVLVDMLEHAERLRAALAALAATAGEQDVRHVAGETSAVLRLVADALTGARDERKAAVAAVVRRSAALAIPVAARWHWTGEALLGQLRAIASDLSRLDAARTGIAARARARPALPPPSAAAARSLPVLRASLSLTSETGRHALRLASAAGVAAALVVASGLEDGRWVVLTILLVLKPDYDTTLHRAPQRAVGTFAGAGVGLAAVQLGHLGPGGLVLAVAVCVTVGYATFDLNYVVYSMSLTAFLVVVLEILGTPALPTAEARLLDTTIGSAIALAAYLAWPTWEGITAQEKFARLMETHRDYSTVLLQALGGSSRLDLARLRKLQGGARRARVEAAASVTRLQDERRHPPLTPEAARALMDPISRLAHAELVLHALLSRPPLTDSRAGALADAVGEAMTELAAALRELRRPVRAPALRVLLTALHEPPADAGLAAGADALVDAIAGIEVAVREAIEATGAARGAPR